MRIEKVASGENITELLQAWRAGDRDALGEAMPKLYDVLRQMASARLRGEAEATLSPTGLVHEALLRLLGADVDFANRAHFLGLAALHMRAVLVDQARARLAAKRGGGALRVTLDGQNELAAENTALDLLALDQALTRLGTEDKRAARVMEMSCFAGMERNEIAAAIGVSVPTIDRDLRFARAWLNRALA
ncbi:MAG TPA: ECF-type sigma factor [Rhodanobacteraceae bacterium]|nr:ECF-type sigma factor [Rhodanobacteraceae bacterium]